MCENLDEELRQLIEILSTALQCGNLTDRQTNLTRNVQNVLTNLLKPIVDLVGDNGMNGKDGGLLSRSGDDNDDSNKRPLILNILTPFTRFNSIPMDSNGTSSIIPNSFNLTTTTGGGGVMPTTTTTMSTLTTPTIRLHRLEIIKVIVLIVVISIILVSTCRMVFQLFLRFRPSEKAEYHQG